MELVAGRPVVRLMINGKGPYAFLVSTGAQTTVIDEKLAAELGAQAARPEKPKPGEKSVEPPKDKPKEQDKKAAAMLELDLEAGTTKLTKVAVLPTDITKYVAEAGLAGRSRGVLSLAAWKDHRRHAQLPAAIESDDRTWDAARGQRPGHLSARSRNR